MDVSRLLNLPCTITTVTEGEEDEYGDPTEEAADSSTVCWITRRGATRDGEENVGAENWQIDTLDLYLPPGTAITGNDRVTVKGITYEVVGPPHEHTHPRTLEAVYVSAIVRRVT